MSLFFFQNKHNSDEKRIAALNWKWQEYNRDNKILLNNKNKRSNDQQKEKHSRVYVVVDTSFCRLQLFLVNVLLVFSYGFLIYIILCIADKPGAFTTHVFFWAYTNT